MSSCVALHSQLASIMEVLANAAVAEICKLIDDGYAVLHSELSRNQKEIDVLRRKLSLQTMELRIAKEARIPTTNTPFNKQLDNCFWKDVLPLAEDHEALSEDSNESADKVQVQSQSVQIKKETLEPDLEDYLRIRLNRAEECNVGEQTSTADLEPEPAIESDELSALHSNKQVLEDCGLDSGLKAEMEQEAASTKDMGSEPITRRLNCLSYEYISEERSSQQSVFSSENPACHYPSANDLNRVPSHAGLQLRCDAEKGSGETSKDFIDVKTATASAPSELDDDYMQEMVLVKHRQCKEYREEQLLSGNITNTYSPQLRVTVKENIATVSKSTASDLTECSLFNQSFNTQKRDKAQHRSGRREKRFICTYCGKSFTCPKNLETHQRVHTGEKPFSCTQCGKRFADSSNRKRHQIIHTGERPYSCTLCGKRFTQSSCLIAHQRVHTGEKPFSCSQCGKRFADSSNLKRHQSVHIVKKTLSHTLWEDLNCFKAS